SARCGNRVGADDPLDDPTIGACGYRSYRVSTRHVGGVEGFLHPISAHDHGGSAACEILPSIVANKEIQLTELLHEVEVRDMFVREDIRLGVVFGEKVGAPTAPRPARVGLDAVARHYALAVSAQELLGCLDELVLPSP